MNWPLIKKRAIQTFWILSGIGMVVLLGAAMQRKQALTCKDIRVSIAGAEEHMFIDEQDVLKLIKEQGVFEGRVMGKVALRSIEEALEQNPWIKNAELFFDNQRVLEVSIEERQPIARVFTAQGNSFYLDSVGIRLPLSDKLSARVPMFTGFPSDLEKLSKPDSLLLQGILSIGNYIMVDSFWRAQTAQIDINKEGQFELIPVVGDHRVVLGSAEELDAKLNRLYTFYRQAWLQNGIHRYEKLDVQYKGQVVAVKRGTAQALLDSAQARAQLNELMQLSLVLPADTVQTKPAVEKKVEKPAANNAAKKITENKKLPVVKDNKTAQQNAISNGKVGAKDKAAPPKEKPASKPPTKPVPKAVMQKQ
ncbi:MAG: hypothetical protein J0L83_06825 [Chitinophagales bacterium]|nr:hypothetical protein [Chitinophagales bacterium]